jgi:hypothetical protein
MFKKLAQMWAASKKPKNGSSSQNPSQSSTKAKKAHKTDAPHFELMADANDKFVLAFGLKWQAIISRNMNAQTLVAKAKATHALFRASQVGYGRLPKNIKKIDVPIYSAAVLAAKHAVGLGYFLLKLEDRHYWVCQVRNSAPTSHDKLLRCSEYEAIKTLSEMMGEFHGEHAVVYTDIANLGLNVQTQGFSVEDLFLINRIDSTDRLPPFKRKALSIPKPFIYLALGVIVVLLLKEAYTKWADNKRKQELQALVQAEDPPEVAWKPVLEKFVNQHAMPSNDALLALSIALHEIPVMLEGWRLSGTRCQAQIQVGGKAKRWNCVASYERMPIGKNSETIKPIVLAKFHQAVVNFSGLTGMQVAWGFDQPATTITLKDLPSPDVLNLEMISRLQDTLSVMASRPDFKFQPLELPAPKRKDGKAHPKPAYVPDLYQAEVVIKTPLRSIEWLAEKLPKTIEWNAIGLVFSPTTSATSKTVNSSSFMTELNGIVLAKRGEN